MVNRGTSILWTCRHISLLRFLGSSVPHQHTRSCQRGGPLEGHSTHPTGPKADRRTAERASGIPNKPTVQRLGWRCPPPKEELVGCRWGHSALPLELASSRQIELIAVETEVAGGGELDGDGATLPKGPINFDLGIWIEGDRVVPTDRTIREVLVSHLNEDGCRRRHLRPHVLDHLSMLEVLNPFALASPTNHPQINPLEDSIELL